MSVRAIVAATGLDRKTIRRDLQVGERGPRDGDGAARDLALTEARTVTDSGVRVPLDEMTQFESSAAEKAARDLAIA